jgi:hypothetical protein
MLFFGQIVKKASTATIYPHSELSGVLAKAIKG